MSGISSVYCYLHRRHFKYTRAIPRHFQVFCYHVILFRVLIGYFVTDLDWPFPQSSYLSSKQPRLKNSWTQISWNLYALRSLKYSLLCGRCTSTFLQLKEWFSVWIFVHAKTRVKQQQSRIISIDLALINFLQCELDKLMASPRKNFHVLAESRHQC